ncbi:phytanoyl-CoA dioxygenase family protein [Moorena bouillonii]|uniref:Phytanoyl-CoA dioxygenase n=1 Tax=Moorena bouillonii PNG TaxID=568701 RepID=A0A1U7N3S7_9CYAN|nr:phytanoyl-CoA dioxygenase family protein [Moorena bouillonii]OLT60603.1 phytanoyl-CoA dioxygenase [Moorena bouillonii PNG]
MYLQEEQQKTYQENGFLLLDNLFDKAQIKAITAKLSTVSWKNTPGTVLEEDQATVRGIHEDPTENGFLDKISKNALIVEPAMQLLGSQVYIHQLKINFKAAFSGDLWPWHQDYIFWQKEDGMPTPRAVNVVIFLEEVNEFNGPLCLIPGSHQEGVISSLNQIEQDYAASEDSKWISSFQSNLKYTTPEQTIIKLVEKYGIEAPKGKPGTVLFFHPNCVHGSANNISPFSRKIAIITYNSIDNIPIAVDNPRPDFLVGRDYRAIKPLPDQALIL